MICPITRVLGELKSGAGEISDHNIVMIGSQEHACDVAQYALNVFKIELARFEAKWRNVSHDNDELQSDSNEVPAQEFADRHYRGILGLTMIEAYHVLFTNILSVNIIADQLREIAKLILILIRTTPIGPMTLPEVPLFEKSDYIAPRYPHLLVEQIRRINVFIRDLKVGNLTIEPIKPTAPVIQIPADLTLDHILAPTDMTFDAVLQIGVQKAQVLQYLAEIETLHCTAGRYFEDVKIYLLKLISNI